VRCGDECVVVRCSKGDDGKQQKRHGEEDISDRKAIE
jgi:hypothetical protein